MIPGRTELANAFAEAILRAHKARKERTTPTMISDSDFEYEKELQEQSRTADIELNRVKDLLTNAQERARLLDTRVYQLRRALQDLIDATVDGSSLWISETRGAAIYALHQTDHPIA